MNGTEEYMDAGEELRKINNLEYKLQGNPIESQWFQLAASGLKGIINALLYIGAPKDKP